MVLKFLRKPKNIKKAGLVLALLIVPAFILWGVGSALRSRNTMDKVGMVFGKVVREPEYRRSWNLSRNFTSQIYGKDIPDSFIDQLAWNRLILIEEAKHQNIKITNEEVLDAISKVKQFQINEQFSPLLYKRTLGTNARSFEEEMRNDLKISRLRENVIGDIAISDEELRAEYQKTAEQAVASYIFINPLDYTENVQLADNELEEYYQQNGEEFRKALQVNIKYIYTPYEDLEDEAVINAEDIEEYYADHLNQFTIKKTEQIAPVEEAIEEETLQPESTSDIEAESIPATETISYQPLEAVSTQIEQKLRTIYAQDLTYERLEEIRRRFLDEKNVQKVVNELGLKLQETGYFAKEDQIPGIGLSYEFADEAFNLTTPGQISGVVETPTGCYVLILQDKKAAHIPTLEAVKNDVAVSVLHKKARENAIISAEELRIKMAAIMSAQSKTFAEAAKDLELEVTTLEPFNHSGYLPGIGYAPEFITAVFDAQPGTMLEKTIATQLGSYIVHFDKIIPVTDDDFEKNKEAFRKELLKRKREEKYDEWFQKVREKADLQIFEEEEEE